MAAGTEFSPPSSVLEVGCNKDNAAALEGEVSDSLSDLKQMTNRKPPRYSSALRHSVSSVGHLTADDLLDDASVSTKSPSNQKSRFLPVFRSGSCAERGPKHYMEDEHVCIDNLIDHFGETDDFSSPGAFYGVFDGHGGTDAASFIRKNILKYIVDDSHFPRTLRVANAGDCRAVLGRRGRAVEMSKDHKPNCKSERLRIENLGGVIYDGYLNGQLSVARALGDWHMKGAKGSACPLSAEPELQETRLTEDDEFLIMGCDGLWDVMSSQCAVTMTRKELMVHNDPERCSRELVREALMRNACDNLTVIVVCFLPDPPPKIEIPQTRVRRSISLEGLNLLKGVLDCNS
ncbi:hypothetical protein C1H46_016145 [Malus baccata]|uniref:protein-serine/threonine phosphatase n=1 Tax=Malus baccata TaxID=106549 RepID=A0A540MHX4_MALBA|nr:hypothetical protein C1H46_016145 [Malus baccata]